MPTFESWLCFLRCLETPLGEELSGLFCGHLEFQNDGTQEAFILQGFRRPRAHRPESCRLGGGGGGTGQVAGGLPAGRRHLPSFLAALEILTLSAAPWFPKYWPFCQFEMLLAGWRRFGKLQFLVSLVTIVQAYLLSGSQQTKPHNPGVGCLKRMVLAFWRRDPGM